jgi:hypothetical protein
MGAKKDVRPARDDRKVWLLVCRIRLYDVSRCRSSRPGRVAFRKRDPVRQLPDTGLLSLSPSGTDYLQPAD